MHWAGDHAEDKNKIEYQHKIRYNDRMEYGQQEPDKDYYAQARSHSDQKRCGPDRFTMEHRKAAFCFGRRIRSRSI